MRLSWLVWLTCSFFSVSTIFARADESVACRDAIDQRLIALIEKDVSGVLAAQLRLTTLKIAVETLKKDKNTVEAYLGSEFEALEKADRETKIRQSLLELYRKNELGNDLQRISEKYEKARYSNKRLRFRNEELAAYVLAHQKITNDSPYNETDAAILWYQAKVARLKNPSGKIGTRKQNLLQASTLITQYTGLLAQAKRWTVPELERKIAYYNEAVEGIYRSIAEALTKDLAPVCANAKNCPDCGISPESVSARFQALLQDWKKIEGPMEGEPTPNVTAGTTRLTSTREVVVYDPPKSPAVSLESIVQDPEERREKPNGNPMGVSLAAPETLTEPQIASLYSRFLQGSDPSAPLSEKAFRIAITGFEAKRKKDPSIRADRLTIVDFDQPTWKKRLYVLDLREGKVLLQAHTTHAEKSDPDRDGIPTVFGNRSGSELSSIGFFKTTQIYKSNQWGRSLRIDGLDGRLNSNVLGRGVVVHGIKYMNSKIGQPGEKRDATSLGCFAVSETEKVGVYGVNDPRTVKNYLIDQISDGSLIYAHSSFAKRTAIRFTGRSAFVAMTSF